MNRLEIDAIEDFELRRIYEKYWVKRHNAFMDEHGIPDWELERVTDEIDRAEEREVAAYLKKKETVENA